MVLIEVRLRVGPLRVVIANVFVPVSADTTNTVGGFVAAVARGDNIFPLFPAGSDEHPPLHCRGRVDAPEPQRADGDVQEVDQVLADRSRPVTFRLKLFRDAHHQRHMDASLVEKLLAARHGTPVIAEEKDDRIIRQTFLFQPLQDFSDFYVKMLHRVEIHRPFHPHAGVVRVIRGKFHLFGVDGILLEAVKGPMGFWKVDLSVERLSGFSLIPVGSVEYVFRKEIKVGFPRAPQAGRGGPHVRRMVACLPEVMREWEYALRQAVAVPAMASVLVGSDAGLVHSRNQGRARGRTDRGGRIGPGEPHPFGGQPVDIRCANQTVPIATEIGAQVLSHDPKNVGRYRAVRRTCFDNRGGGSTLGEEKRHSQQ